MSASSVIGASRVAAGRGAMRPRAPSVPVRNRPPPAEPDLAAATDTIHPPPRSAGRGRPLRRQNSSGPSLVRPSSVSFSHPASRPAGAHLQLRQGENGSHTARTASPARSSGGARSEFAQAVLDNMNNHRHRTNAYSNNNNNNYHRHRNDNDNNSYNDLGFGGGNSRRQSRNKRSEHHTDERSAVSSSARLAEIAAARAQARQEWFDKSKAFTDGGGDIQGFSISMSTDPSRDGDPTHDLEEGEEDEKDKGPFAWGDLQAAVDQLPEGHWAAPYLRGVANSLHQNASMSSARKRLMMQQVTTSLASVSQADAMSSSHASVPN